MSGTRKAAPPAERKTASGPIITPQVLGIAFGIILLIGIIVYYQMVVNKFTNDISQAESAINRTDQTIQTYRKKGDMKDTADELNKTIRARLASLNYMFLEDQNSMLPFWNQTMFPLVTSGTLTITSDTVITAEEFRYKINMAMDPFRSLPGFPMMEDETDAFPIDYFGERDGMPEESPLDTRPDAFLDPYNITLENFRGTYEDCKRFVERIQKLRRDKLITIHCIVNDPDSTTGLFRSSTDWTMEITVYFMNPDAPAGGSEPPEPPGSRSC